MAKILEKSIPFGNGIIQKQFMGLRVGRLFTLVPDSDTGWRPEVLRVTNQKDNTLLLHGGKYFTAEIASEGVARGKYLQRLSLPQTKILSALACDLTRRLLPMAGHNLQKQVERLGEDEVVAALQNLFKGVEEVERGRRISRWVLFFGKWLEAALFPAISF